MFFNSFYFESSENKHLVKTPTRPASSLDHLQDPRKKIIKISKSAISSETYSKMCVWLGAFRITIIIILG